MTKDMRSFLSIIEENSGDQYQSQTIKWGFDHTSIPTNKWKLLLKQISASEYPIWHSKDISKYWVWRGDGVVIYTYYNPFTGQKTPDDSVDEDDNDGFVGYIGIEGNKDAVTHVVKFIKKNATDIKDESPRRRDFI